MKNLWKCKCGYQSWEDGFNKENVKIIKVRCPLCNKRMWIDKNTLEKYSISAKNTKDNRIGPRESKKHIIK